MIPEAKIEAIVDRIFSDATFPEEPKGLYDPLRYMISLGGKRLRPKLCLLIYSLWKHDFDESITEPAIGLEFFHNFTLIHDDIMDNSPLRRGKETVWKKWSEVTGILSGDELCIESFRRIAMAPPKVLPTVLDVFTRTAQEVCDGQQMDTDFEGRDDVTMEEYMKMISLKTAVLLGCSAAVGAIIGGASEKDVANLYDYAFQTGLAFQITDDLLDTYGNVEEFGKPIGGDIIMGKKTWLVTRAMEKASPEIRADFLDAMHMPAEDVIADPSPEASARRAAKIARVKSIYDLLEIPQDAEREILSLCEKGLASAAKSCDGVAYEMLRRFTMKLVGRNK